MRAFAYFLGMLSIYMAWQLFYIALPSYMVQSTISNYLTCTSWLSGSLMALHVARTTYRRGHHEN